MVKVIESAAGDQFAATDFIAVLGTGSDVAFTTNGTATNTASSNGNAGNNRAIVDYLKRSLVPKYDGSNYVCVASINYLSGFHADTGSGGWVDISKYTDTAVRAIFSGEVGTYYMTRFVEENGYLQNNVGASSNKGQAVYLGSDTVYEAVVVPEEIRVKTSLDYGRDHGLAWYALLGFKLVWDYAVDGEQHVLFVTSA
jgi:N4-gp56 family major capsid protein